MNTPPKARGGPAPPGRQPTHWHEGKGRDPVRCRIYLKGRGGELDRIVEEVERVLSEEVERQDGELNYLFTKILLSAYKPKYFNYNRAMGLLESIKQEFYRRFVAPYEKEVREHGDL